MGLPSPTDHVDGHSGSGRAGISKYSNCARGGQSGHVRSSSQHRFDVGSFRGGSFYPTNDVEGNKAIGIGVGTCTALGMGKGCCTNPAKGTTGSPGAPTEKSGCATPEGCRCVNLDDPQKVFKLVLQAIRHINDGEGATPVEIHCYMRKHHRMPDDEDKLMQIVKDSLKRGICIGCLRRRYCDGKYYISQKSSGRSKRKPNAGAGREAASGKKATSKKAAANKKRKRCPLPIKSKKKFELSKARSRPKAKKGSFKKSKSKKKGGINPRMKNKLKSKCPAKKNNKRKAAATSKAKGKCKSKSARPKAKCPKPSESPSECPKKTKCSLFPNIWPNFEMKAANKVDCIWDDIPPFRW